MIPLQTPSVKEVIDMTESKSLHSAETMSYQHKEELINAITHGIGVVFCLVMTIILLIDAAKEKNAVKIVAFSIYGLCSTCLYLFSTLYHSIPFEKPKKILRIFDHCSIFLFIAGTYTPIALIAFTGALKWGILGSVWAIALFGIGFKIVTYGNYDKYKKVSTLLYILMGWIVIFAIKPTLAAVPFSFLLWILIGGLFFTVGCVFYVKKKPYMHAVWHLFVLAGSVCHFIGIFLYLA